MRQYFLILVIFFSFFSKTESQELNLDIKITTPALKTADPKSLKTLEHEIRDFFNNTKWTDDDFDRDERIEGAFQINIKEDISSNRFIADFFISTGRPVYNSNYTTPILNHVEKDIAFIYEELTPLRNNSSIFTDNLSAILTFYAYVIIGYDYDSFSPSGGEDFFKLANNIISNVPPNVYASDPSWTALGGERNRYWLIENLLNPRMKGYRRAFYDYHRNGLDKIYNDVGTSKAVLLSSLKQLEQVNNTYPKSMVLQMFSNSKRAEVVEIFKNSVKTEQRQIYRIMSSIDPSQSDFLVELR